MKVVRPMLSILRDAGAVIAFVIIWQLLTIAFTVPAFLVPPPSAIGEALVANAGRIAAALGQTAAEAALGFAGGNVLGLGTALHDVREELPTWRGQNEQGMALAAVGFARATDRRQVMAVTTSMALRFSAASLSGSSQARKL